MSSEVFEALSLLEKERGIPVDFMLDKIKKAILTACKSSYNGNDDAIINKGRGSAGYQAIWPDRRADRPEYYPSGHP